MTFPRAHSATRQGALISLLKVSSGQMLLKIPPEIASNVPLVRDSDDLKNPEKCNEAPAAVSEV